jgi:hypothetical protein
MIDPVADLTLILACGCAAVGIALLCLWIMEELWAK